MAWLDELIADWAGRGSVGLTVVVAVLLGLRHATDPDHLAAVTTLIAGDGPARGRLALRLGLSWGLGHGLALLAIGGAFVLGAARLPAGAQTGIEVLVGLIVIALALRLLLRSRRRGVVAHRHGLPLHTHRVRGRGAAFAVGLAHGAGGSAGVSVLLLARIGDPTLALVVLALFAAGTALSMSLASIGFARALGGARQRRLMPAMGLGGVALGVLYVLGAVGA
jgi:high-affinity nickel-transport protein